MVVIQERWCGLFLATCAPTSDTVCVCFERLCSLALLRRTMCVLPRKRILAAYMYVVVGQCMLQCMLLLCYILTWIQYIL